MLSLILIGFPVTNATDQRELPPVNPLGWFSREQPNKSLR